MLTLYRLLKIPQLTWSVNTSKYLVNIARADGKQSPILKNTRVFINSPLWMLIIGSIFNNTEAMVSLKLYFRKRTTSEYIQKKKSEQGQALTSWRNCSWAFVNSQYRTAGINEWMIFVTFITLILSIFTQKPRSLFDSFTPINLVHITNFKFYVVVAEVGTCEKLWK